MKRTTPWLTALHARQRHREEWIKDHPNSSEPVPEEVSYSYSDVKTRDVIDKTREDSFTCVVLPFKSDPWFLDAYVNPQGRLRVGQIFQDLDSLAGVIAYRHCSPAEPVIVTASVDRIYMLKRLDNIADYNVTLTGSVTWTGRSSMEITIKAGTTKREFNPDSEVSDADIRDDDVFLTANFTFVARDPKTKKSFPINRLIPQNEREQRDYDIAEQFNHRKKAAAKEQALHQFPPSKEEAELIHSMWMRQQKYLEDPAARPAHVVNVASTRIFSTSVMQPQYRNRHSYMIFGGYLLRQTFELAYACSAALSHGSPRFVSLDSTTFRNPVPVGSVLYLTATVAYVKRTHRQIEGADGVIRDVPGFLIQVRVDSTVRNLEHGTTTPTGEFVYSYFVEYDGRDWELLPETYTEMMEWIEGRRRAISTADFLKHTQVSLPHTVISE
jgi:acyl-coenzyme A thioesterase 9